jgi:4a-hydroxytetrahydrobiopterin dehydratase
MEIISATAFDAELDVGEWRYILGSAEAMYRAGSFVGAARFAEAVAVLADELDHHPDIDIRQPDIVHIRSITRFVNGLTERDIALARRVSELAAGAGVIAVSATATGYEIAIDAMDIPAVMRFWRAVFGYEWISEAQMLVDPLRIGPAIWFQQMDVPRPERNNIHLDVSVTHDVAEARVAAAIAAGGTLLSDTRAPAFWVLADVEGNEACVCTWQNRD